MRETDRQNYFVLNYFDHILSLVAALPRWVFCGDLFGCGAAALKKMGCETYEGRTDAETVFFMGSCTDLLFFGILPCGAAAEGPQFQRKYLAWADFWRIIPDLFLIFMEEA